jgi:hypothetical protein
MNDAKTSAQGAQPGRYGAGYGEQQPARSPEPPPALESARDAPAGLEPLDPGLDPASPPAGSDGAPVVFTPDDVSARPPDHPPTEAAPQSEKAALIFERS